MPASRPSRPLGLVVAVVTTLAFALFFVVMAGLSLSSGHGAFSIGPAIALILWGGLVGACGVFLWRGARWARGPVVAAALLHVFAFAELAMNGSPVVLIGAVAALAIVVGVLHPVSRAWLNREG